MFENVTNFVQFTLTKQEFFIVQNYLHKKILVFSNTFLSNEFDLHIKNLKRFVLIY